ncbi:hypothetical protein MKX01_030800 [Papaver californicum]|nr:hypothetical protein MKX01_030800 [Papaver californicum]
MPNPLRMSGSNLSGSKNSSDKGSTSSDTKNEDKEKKKKKGKNLSAAKYREILLKSQGRDHKKSDKKKKLIVRFKVSKDSSQGGGVREKVGGGHYSGSKGKGLRGGLSGCSSNVEGSAKVGSERKRLEIDDPLEEGEIRDDNTVPPEEDGRKLNAKVCGRGGGGVGEECCKDVQPRDSVLMAETGCGDKVCFICKLGGSGKLLCCYGKGCKKNYHLKCLDPPLKGVPLGLWHCACCVKKNIGVQSLPGAVESNLDAVEVELANSKGVDTSKNNFCNKNDSNDCVEELKRRLVRVAASEHKSESKFVESWVPVKLSDVQLEQYCNILLSNSELLRSSSKNDTVEALRDVLISIRKCCDHPYFVEPSVQKMLTDGLSEAEYLNVGIKASGKLQVLDKILSETKKRGLRVLIIFQSNVGSIGITLGDVLDDVVRQRCGVDSYERVDCGLIVSKKNFAQKKQAAMNKFNDKEKGRIVFLLDRRACHPSIKLSSVNIVILYDSDLNPYNDLKVLHKITIDSQHELKVFRLYSVCTLEEVVLVNAKQDVTVDAQNLNHSTIHQLLRWGASYLFIELVDFHSSSPSSGSIFSSEHLVKELFGPLARDGGSSSTNNSSIVVKVNRTGGKYSSDISLPGELEMQSVDEDLPHVFWTKLLNRKTPKWRYLPAASLPQRIHKRVQYFEGSLEKPDSDFDDVMKKRRKVLTGTVDARAQKPVLEDKIKVCGVIKEGASETPARECSQYLPSPAVPTGVARFRKANGISSVPAASMGESVKISVPQELEGEIRESHQRCETVLPPPSESPCPEPLLELLNNSASGSASQPDIRLENVIQYELPRPERPVENPIELVNNSALGSALQHDIQLDDGIQSEPPRPEPPGEDQVELVDHSASRSASQPDIQLGIQSEHPRPEPPVEDQVDLVNKSASGSASQPDIQLNNVIQSEHPHPESPVEDQVELVNKSASGSASLPDILLDNGIQLGHITPQQAEYPTQQPATKEHAELPSLDVVVPLEPMVQLPMSIDRSLGGSGTRVSDSRSMGGVAGSITHPRQSAPMTSSWISQSLLHHEPFFNESAQIHKEQDQVGLVINSSPQPIAQLDYGILPLGRNTSQRAEFPTQPATTEGHFELPTYSNGLQDIMLQQSRFIDRCVGGSGTRVTDFRSLGVVPDCVGHPLHIAPLSSSQTSQTLLRGDPLLNELARIRQEREKAVKFHEELKMRIRFDFHKEVQEIYKKYMKLDYDNDTALAQTKNAIESNYNKVAMNVMLAKYLRDKWL